MPLGENLREWTQLVSVQGLPRSKSAGQAVMLLEGMQRSRATRCGVPVGRAADLPEWLLQPYELLDLGEMLTQIGPAAKARGCTINAGNNLGYYGPAERHLRIEPYGGCGAGRFVLGVESNGDVKGCPSLPSAPYVGGNVREAPLAEIWERQAIGFARARGTSELWGFCKTCYYAEVCQGGCSWTAHALLGRRGNMP